MATIETGVTCNAHDKKPVDIVHTILGTDQANCDHLKLRSAGANHLATVANWQALRNSKTASAIRNCSDQHHATEA